MKPGGPHGSSSDRILNARWLQPHQVDIDVQTRRHRQKVSLSVRFDITEQRTRHGLVRRPARNVAIDGIHIKIIAFGHQAQIKRPLR